MSEEANKQEELNNENNFDNKETNAQTQNSKDVVKTAVNLDTPLSKFPDGFPKEPEFAPPYPQKNITLLL